MRSNVSFHRRAMVAIIAAFVICALGGSHALAQRFQFHYGDPMCSDAGHYGVKLVNAGNGYIAVGETFGNVPGCDASDIYVVRTNFDGTLMWSFAYDIGEFDSATDVVEDPNGDFVITGVTSNGGGCPVSRDVFLLRIDLNGVVLAVNTIGSPDLDEIAWNIVRTLNGDYALAGSATFVIDGVANRDAYLIRANPALGVIWDARYGGIGTLDDYFYGVEEIQTDGTNDLVAVGGTNTVSFGNYDVLMVRVDPNTGGMFSPVQNLAIHGLAGFEEGREIIEIRSGAFTGDLVVTGMSLSRPAPSTNFEILMLQTAGDPCVLIADQFAGDNLEGPDGGIDLKEDLLTDAEDVMVTGFTDFGDFVALIPPNVFLQRFALGTMVATGGINVYGGDDFDAGWSVNLVDPIIDPVTPGYIVAGFTQSPNLIGADPEQLYLIKTDIMLSSGCNEMDTVVDDIAAGLLSACTKVVPTSIGLECKPEIETIPLDFATMLCLFPTRARERNGNGNDGVAGVEAPAVLTFNEGTVVSYPNPIASGAKLNLRFDLATPANARITISDIIGRVIHESEVSLSKGSAMRAIETTGWTSGTYLVRIELNGASSISRIVVLER